MASGDAYDKAAAGKQAAYDAAVIAYEAAQTRVELLEKQLQHLPVGEGIITDKNGQKYSVTVSQKLHEPSLEDFIHELRKAGIPDDVIEKACRDAAQEKAR